MGAKFVKNEFKRQKNKMKKMEIEMNIQQQTSDIKEDHTMETDGPDAGIGIAIAEHRIL